MSQINDYKSSSTEAGVIAFYWRVIIRPNFRSALLVAALMLVAAGLETVTVGLAVPIIDAIMRSEAVLNNPDVVLPSIRLVVFTLGFLQSFGLSGDINVAIMVMLTVAVLLFLMSGGFALLHQYLTAGIALRLRRETQSSLFQRLVYARFQDISMKSREETLHDITAPSHAVHATIRQLGILFTGIFNSVLMLGLLLYLSWWATIFIGLLVVFGVRGLRKFMDRRAEGYGRTIYKLQGTQKKVEGDTIDGLRVVKAEGLESSLLDRHQGLLLAELVPTMRLTLFRHAPLFLNEAAAAVIVLILGAMTFMVPSLGMNFPTLTAFLLAIRRVSPAVAGINSSMVDLNTHRKSIEVIDEILNRTEAEPTGSKPVQTVEELKFENVGFVYSSRKNLPALDKISMTLKRGTINAIVGATGAGKSTIADLALGLHRPTYGRILVDGVDLMEIEIGSWRERIGYVPQDAFLFNASVRENITGWAPGIKEKELFHAAKLADLYDFVSTLPDGFDTQIGDRGFALSGGQRQRIAIARALLRRPDLLILDEATSALDNRTEKVVYDTVTTLRKHAIILVVAHRLSTVRQADQIFVLDSGRVLERGTHESLVAKGGPYTKLYQIDDSKDGEERFVASGREENG